MRGLRARSGRAGAAQRSCAAAGGRGAWARPAPIGLADRPVGRRRRGREPARRGPDTPYFPRQPVAFIFPLSTNAAAPDLATHLDLALLLGRVGFVDGAQVGLFSWTSGDLRGLQLGGRERRLGARRGAAVAGASPSPMPCSRGAQLGGLFGWASTTVVGAQIAGVANQTYADVDGLQAAGAVNVARGQVMGVQAAGAVNVGRVDGLQIGAINVSQEQRGPRSASSTWPARSTGSRSASST